MTRPSPQKNTSIKRHLYLCIFLLLTTCALFSQPINDNCSNASTIAIANNGYSTGIFTSTTYDITTATTQSSETYAPAILVAGQNKKSIWYKFILPTTRSIRITLLQSGSSIPAGDAGFAVYKTQTCLPTNADLSTKLTPIATFGNTFHPCVDSGVYLVQVSAKAATSGLLAIQINCSNTGALYDAPTDAYTFGQLSQPTSHIDFAVDCQSIEDGNETCPTLYNNYKYTKSTWHTFKTPAYFDYLSVLLCSPSGNFSDGLNVFGYQLYKGDAKAAPLSTLALVDGCDSLSTTGYYTAYKLYKCGQLEANTTYSVQLFYKQDFNENIRLAIAYGGASATNAPEPVSAMSASNKLGILPSSPTGTTTAASDYLACNSRHSTHPCGDALPAAGIPYLGNNYNLSTFYTFTLSSSASIILSGNSVSCGNPPLLLRLYKQDVGIACTSISNTNLIGYNLSTLSLNCLLPGTYTLQVLGMDTTSSAYSYYFYSLANSAPLCMLASLGQKVEVSIKVTSVNALNKFSLNIPGAYDKINTLNALQNGLTYQAVADTFGCSNTVLPAGALCSPDSSKAMYRQFLVADSGIVTLTNKTYNFLYKFFQGNADALSTQQNKHFYPDRFTGLTAISQCRNFNIICTDDKVCVIPGTYTLATFGGINYSNTPDRPSVQLNIVNTKHYDAITAQDMGNLLDSLPIALTSDIDYFSCKDNAVTINGAAPCSISGYAATKATYRQFYLKSPCIISINGTGTCGNGGIKKMFSGKATDGLATLQPLGSPWNCFNNAQLTDRCNALPAGWYTVVSYGSGPTYADPLQHLNEKGYASYVGTSDQFTITITTACEGPKYNRPYKASIDTITHEPYLVNWPPTRAYVDPIYLNTENFNCTIDAPFVSQIPSCGPTLNRIAYYVFRTSKPTSIQIGFQSPRSFMYAVYKLDVRTDSALFRTTAPILTCTNSYTAITLCKLQPGTYTLVAYVGNDMSCSAITPIFSRPCNEPWYNRPYKAAVDSITHNPFVIDWGPRTGSTAAYPRTDTTYNLYTEYFDCSVDTPFSSHPISTCNINANRVAYYVFKVLRESYVKINTLNYWAAVYPLDVRLDSALFMTTAPVQPCLQSAGYIQLCKLQPGTYTLVVYAGNSSSCASISPSIYIDQVAYSRFDHASRAYDFGTIKPDSTFYDGKMGDVNPLDANRAPSNDFFYCTTGSRNTDPIESGCYVLPNANIYNTQTNNYLFSSQTNLTTARRNLWYTFVMDKPGNVMVKVTNKTTGKQSQSPFSIYKSNVDASLPYQTVVNTGQVDSTVAQGLSFVKNNKNAGNDCYNLSEQTGFYRDPCSFSPSRYYILVDNNFITEPNSQIEVAVLLDSVRAILQKFDHYYQANDLGSVSVGTHTGATDNYTCATKDATDPTFNDYANCAQKTLWYKFTSTVTGQVRFRFYVNGVRNYAGNNIQLFKQIIAGDSTSSGLVYQNSSTVFDNVTGSYWLQNCVASGTYYILLTGCNQINEYAYPEIQLMEQAGDYCSAPVLAPLTGPGNNTASTLIDCHTIGTDYGEFNPMLTCPANTPRYAYKSSWFRIDVSGNDTLDVTAYLEENTTANSSQIKYRLMTGNCGAMQEQSCVQDALTQNTYKCLVPGSYFIQVFSPVNATGNIKLKLSAVKHTDTCAPVNSCLANANFIPQFDCNLNDSVRFINYSTYGSAIQYIWNFDYNNQSSTAVSPSFAYPALATSQTYNVTLITKNTSCNGQSSVTIPITISARPYVELGRDTMLCNGGTILLDATTHAGTTYQWSTGATTSTILANQIGVHNYWVKATYNNCTKWDSINVTINPIITQNIHKVLCGNDSILLSAYRGHGESYQWSNGFMGSSFYITTPGIYWCDVKLYGCTKRDSFNITGIVYPFFTDSLQACFSANNPYVLNATTPGALNYSWQNNSGSATISITTAGLYWVVVNFGTCSVLDSIVVDHLQALRQTISTTICTGQLYTLPSGTLISSAGIYSDTLKSAAGCDSIISKITIFKNEVIHKSSSAVICQGQNYTLPSGANVNSAGIYYDTLHYVSGCDSIVQTITLNINTVVNISLTKTICQGQSYSLPWGNIVTAAGNYADTLKGSIGCDSIISTIVLSVVPKPAMGINPPMATVCDGDTLRLQAYGGTAYQWFTGSSILSPTSASTLVFPAVSGNYQVSIHNAVCNETDTFQSIVSISPLPDINITKSNDISCVQGSAMLKASGGSKYLWWPANGLSNSTISNPLAAPAATTVFYVQAFSANNCMAEDSIEIKVLKNDVGLAYLVPNSFTPNNDGKNDCFGIRSWGMVSDLRFSVYDRYGLLVFTTTNANACWDGTYKDEPQATNAFVYIITANTLCGPIERKGTVVLIR